MYVEESGLEILPCVVLGEAGQVTQPCPGSGARPLEGSGPGPLVPPGLCWHQGPCIRGFARGPSALLQDAVNGLTAGGNCSLQEK